MKQNTSPTEAMISQVKSHPIIIALILVGTVIIAVGDVADRAKYLIELITPKTGHSPETARAELSRLSLPYTANAFVQAARQGDMHAVKLFLAAGMDSNVKDDEKATALQEAMY